MIIALNEKESYVWSVNEEVNHKNQKYSCPACRKVVLFRNGPHLIPHFAHYKNQACHYTSEPESLKHLSGKMQLFKRIEKLETVVYLEKYFSQIKQKSDIYFEHKGKGYAIEFQCSQISLEVLRERTNGYISIGINPIWVFHTDFVKHKGINEVRIPKLVQSGMSSNLQIFLYDGSKKNMLIHSQITPFSKSTYFTNKACIPLNQITIPHLIRQQLLPRKYLSKFREKRNYHLLQSIRFEGLRVPFYKKLYESGFSTFSLPPFVGVPLKNGVAIRTPCIEWQGLIFLDLIKNKEITHTEIHILFKVLLRNKWIETVIICDDFKAHDRALQEYVDLLKEIGFLKGKFPLYQINIKAVQSVDEERVYCCISQSDDFIK